VKRAPDKRDIWPEDELRGLSAELGDALARFVDAIESRVQEVVHEEIERALEMRSPWLDVGGAAAYAAMTPEAIRSATKRGQLRVHRGETGRLRFRIEDLDAFLRGDAG
jgi:hypothetical protein